MAKKNKNYWIERSDKRMEVAHRNANEVTSEVARAYDKAIENICADMENILTNFSKLEGMDKAEALKLLNERISQKRLDEIRAKIATMEDGPIKTQLINKINAQAYKARLTRLQALKENLQVECAQIAQTELAANNKFFVKQAKDTYYRNMFDFSKGIGYAIDFATVPTKRINEILSTNWSGKHYSSRIWENNQVFADKLEEIILHGTMNGYNSRKMAKELQEYANVGKHVSERLLRTETTYIATMSDLEAMKERDTKQLQFVATLDSRTSLQCQKADGKLIDVDKAKPGINVPPLHPYCRSTVIEVMDDLQHKVRIARDENGKPIQVPADMTYPEWKKKYVIEKEAQKSKLNQSTKVNSNYINSKEYHNKFNNLTDNKSVNEKIYKCSKKMLKHRSGTLYEDMYFIDKNTGEVIASSTDMNIERMPGYNKEIKSALKNYDMSQVIQIHNHPSGMPPSAGDFNSAFINGYSKCFTIGHDGSIIEYSKGNKLIDVYEYELRLSLERKEKDEYEAQKSVLDNFKDKYGIEYKEIANGKR